MDAIIKPIDIEREIGRELDRQFAKEYYKSIYEAELLFQETAAVLGWTVTRHSHPDLAEVEQWLEQNCQGKFFVQSYQVMFESAQDAVLFMLRW